MESSVVSGGQPRERRGLTRSVWVKAALVIAAAEAVLVLVGVMPRWTVVVIAALVLVGYFLRGRGVSSPTVRQGIWAVAMSQALVLFVPIILWVVSALVVLVLAAVAVILLLVLFFDR
jgi:hypothetical protein